MTRETRIWIAALLAWLLVAFVLLSRAQEGAIGTYPVPAIVGMSGEAFVATVKVTELPTGRTLGEMPTFHLEIDGSRVTVMGDSHVRLIRWLREQHTASIHLTLTPTRLER